MTLSSTDPHIYALSVGKQDEERLEILNELFNPYTFSILQQIIKPGMSVLDVGCGIGIVSCAMAKLVGPTGKVVCVDRNQEQLDLAKARAAREGISNIAFIRLSVYDLPTLDEQFDLIYSRFLLLHLKEPLLALDHYTSLLAPGGLVFLEEGMGKETADFLPKKTAAFEGFRRKVDKQFQLQQSDDAIGRILPTELQKRGYALKTIQLVHPILRTSREKSLLRLGSASTLSYFQGADAGDIMKTCELLRELETQDDITIIYFEMIQLVAQKTYRQ